MTESLKGEALTFCGPDPESPKRLACAIMVLAGGIRQQLAIQTTTTKKRKFDSEDGPITADKFFKNLYKVFKSAHIWGG